MKASELREKSPSELEESLLELRKEQFNLRMQQSTGQLARPSEVNRVRKEIARVKTVLNEMKAGEA
ncbi:MAG: 50S ribosomal protein L29 [Candidatus Sedimenticola endophacoides]|uniref:Large ribosomal subunit protein uL29 n=1 Tax=Candidatus Sedimenticola endophacoides TaxID=2548426 RepID=A0A657Q2Q8_9GAMM|nr:MAG: 50S ribosomal protein L29 [Candidatus Sedimenticola endophacoides]OQX40365.1 MAG: 50S ribosomal protein L29 [Candidatus Sedimenticola endophacoides]OQX42078.1 MAG: 50S ribosomal protein L29 [Candidatus Sedimenticola endophacoides]OQX42808.1 MAG: 50S ribosomal protein L29 [Candidatus Sedimenticola endophacoides]OQX46356.1 MAG: 50S ribosomal protein L29 [Candidatus Sedimenticola endophacoides]